LRQPIRNFKFTKIHGYDSWSLYITLAYIILPALEKFKSNKHGSPNVDTEDVPENIKDIHERWDWVLNEMIFAFSHIVDETWEDEFCSGEIDTRFEELENGNFLLVDGPNHTYVCDYEGKSKVEARINRGLILFGKYYKSLWD
jgi:hypothetical protein